MPDRKYEILKLIRTKKTVLWIDAINAFDPSNLCNETDAILNQLLADKLIEKVWVADSPPLCTIRLSDLGRITLLAESDRRTALAAQHQNDVTQLDENQERDDRQIPKKNKIDWIAIIGAIAGIIAILEFVFGLFA